MHPLRSNLGFTLIELLLVIVILGVLAGLVIPRFVNRSEQAKVSAAKVDLDANLPTALDLYALDMGTLPTTVQSLRALIESPAGSHSSTWNGPYVRGGIPTDPWGHPYQYRSSKGAGQRGYVLFSFGPDGVEGGADDILSRESTR